MKYLNIDTLLNSKYLKFLIFLNLFGVRKHTRLLSLDSLILAYFEVNLHSDIDKAESIMVYFTSKLKSYD